MLSAFNTKFKALKSRLPQSSLDSPWRMALFWIIATVVILAGFLFIIFWDVFKAMILEGNSSDAPRNDEVAIEDARAAEIEEVTIDHQHYKMNGTVVLGPKDSEW